MAHAIGAAGIEVALEAGVRSIEHGIDLDDGQAARMAAAGTTLVPTLRIYETIAAAVEADPAAFPASVAESGPRAARPARRRRAAGARPRRPDRAGHRLRHRGRPGAGGRGARRPAPSRLAPEQALLAATVRGAELLGVDGEVGRIATGLRFDALLLDGDPGDLDGFAAGTTITGSSVVEPRWSSTPASARLAAPWPALDRPSAVGPAVRHLWTSGRSFEARKT